MKNEKPSVKATSEVAAEEIKTVKAPARKAPVKKSSRKAETAEAVKTAVEEKAAEETKTALKKAPEKKAPDKKVPDKTDEVKETVYLQYLGKEIAVDDIAAQAKEHWTKVQKKKVSDIKSMNIYLKPEENTAYFVINDDVSGSIDL